MFIEWSWIAGLLIGAAIGSFLNVVIYRLPRSMSLGDPKNSFCPNCKHQLTTLDLFPLFSYLALRGKCRHCKVKVPIRYFFVELINGIIWAGIWQQYLIAHWDPARAIAYAFAASALVAVIFIDWELYIIPDQVNASLLVIGLGYNAWLFYKHSPQAVTWGMPSAVAGALVGIGALWGVAFLGRLLFRKDAMGHGDIKMARGIGSVLFPATALVSFGLAVFMGAVLGVAQILLRGKEPEVVETGGEQGDVALATEETVPEDDELPPESIGSLIKSGIGYVLCFDIIGLFYPSFYKTWYGEDPYEPISEATGFEVERTMIPFGPYLALGAIVATIFQDQFIGWVNEYWKWAMRGAAFWNI
jgi:leader peptidase (prepilin peptidase)/N-methyltransferase